MALVIFGDGNEIIVKETLGEIEDRLAEAFRKGVSNPTMLKLGFAGSHLSAWINVNNVDMFVEDELEKKPSV